MSSLPSRCRNASPWTRAHPVVDSASASAPGKVARTIPWTYSGMAAVAATRSSLVGDQAESGHDLQGRQFLRQTGADRPGGRRHRQAGGRDPVVEVRGEGGADGGVDPGPGAGRSPPHSPGAPGDLVEVGVHPIPVVQAPLGDLDRTVTQVDRDRFPPDRRPAVRCARAWFLSARRGCLYRPGMGSVPGVDRSARCPGAVRRSRRRSRLADGRP